MTSRHRGQAPAPESVPPLTAMPPTAAESAASVTTEYAQQAGSGWHLRWGDPRAEEIWPAADWIAAMREEGRKVYRRRVIVIEDWTEVDAP